MAESADARTPQVTERQAREVAEQARESEWNKPSFAKELFLGRLTLDLVHPFPRPTPDEDSRTEEFLARLRAACSSMDGGRIERDARIPDEYVRELAELGCFGMKIPQEYGGLGLSQVAYNRALTVVACVHPSIGALLSAHQSIGVPEPLKLAGTPEQKQRFLPRCARGAISLSCSPNRRRVRPRPTRVHRHPGRGRQRLRTRGRQAVDDQRGGRRTARRHGPRTEERRPSRRDLRLRRGSGFTRHHRRTPQLLHGPARHRERRDPAAQGAGSKENLIGREGDG